MDNSPKWIVFCNSQLLLPFPTELEFQQLKNKILRQHDIGGGYAVDMELVGELPKGFSLYPLREAGLHHLSPELFQLAGRAHQILEWDKTHQYCGKCGVKLIVSQVDRAKICPTCDMHFYPRIAPTMMVLIKRGNEILLARSPHFPEKRYSVLAGFVEPGESLEEAVHREVMEEVGLRVKNLQYRFSQPWPFPHSLMLGFTADYATGDIKIDGIEIEDAAWFTRDNLPDLPLSISISRKLIDLFIHKEF